LFSSWWEGVGHVVEDYQQGKYAKGHGTVGEVWGSIGGSSNPRFARDGKKERVLGSQDIS